MACVAVHPDYRSSSRGEMLLQRVENRARQMGLKKLFVLTTRSIHWFQSADSPRRKSTCCRCKSRRCITTSVVPKSCWPICNPHGAAVAAPLQRLFRRLQPFSQSAATLSRHANGPQQHRLRGIQRELLTRAVIAV